MKNKGLTLIEVLVTVAIMGMVIVLVSGFMNTGMRTSSRANAEANLQKEAQTGLNQVTDWVMSANHGIAVYESSAYYTRAVGIYHDGDTTTDKYVQILFFRAGDKKAYYDKVNIDATFHGTETEIINIAASIDASGTWDNYLFCEYVKDFNMDISHINEKYVELTMVLEIGNIKYNQEPKKIMLRNQPVINPTEYK